MKFDSNFPSRVAMARMALNMTQDDLAQKVGVVRRQIAAYEGGESKPRDKVLANLAVVLGTTPQWLSHGVGESPDISNVRRTVTIPEIPVISIMNAYNYFTSKGEAKNKCIFSFVPSPIDVESDCFAIEILGDSMMSTTGFSIPEGALVTFEPFHEAVHGDFVICALHKEERVVFKQIVFSNDSAYLRSLNPAYPLIPWDPESQIYGRAIHYQVDFAFINKTSLIDALDKSVNMIKEDKVSELLESNKLTNQRLDKIEQLLEKLSVNKTSSSG